MDMTPSLLPDKTPLETVAVYLKLATGIGTATIVGTPTFASDPVGMTFTAATTVDASKTASAMCGGGQAGVDYVVTALCVLSTGETVQPVVVLPVIAPIRETQRSRPIIL